MDKTRHFPTEDEIRDFIKRSPVPPSKREIAKAFNIKGNDKIELKRVLRSLSGDKKVKAQEHKRNGTLPNVLIVKIISLDPKKGIFAEPIEDITEDPVLIKVIPVPKTQDPLELDEKCLVRLTLEKKAQYAATVLKRFGKEQEKTTIGLVETSTRGLSVVLAQRNMRPMMIPPEFSKDLKDGDFVRLTLVKSRGLEVISAVEKLERKMDEGLLSQIVIHKFNLPHIFSPEALANMEHLTVPPLGHREDLRDLPLVTIDGEDARDFDDAVWASPHKDGWHMVVAIADVAHYVKDHSPLDHEAYERGNSVYFPDRVIPMLPEALSNDLCSLRPHTDRAAFAVHLWIDGDGNLYQHKFVRALIQSAARLTYREVQMAHDGKAIDHPQTVKDVIPNLWGAYEILKKSRERRGTLDFDRAEKKVLFTPTGDVAEVRDAPTYESQKLIEEFMISANVAAAQTLTRLNKPCIYRIHDEPDPIRVQDLKAQLQSIGLTLTSPSAPRPSHFTQILKKVHGTPNEHLVNDAILRTQAQAQYSATNIGHFGLNLPQYGHFTSPIRRYSDLILHRLLLRSLGYDETIPEVDPPRLQAMALHLSDRERVAARAEWETTDRYVAAYLSNHIGETFDARITGMVKTGLFIAAGPMEADGFIPVSNMRDDYYTFDPKKKRFLGRRTRRMIRVGDTLRVQLIQADPIANSMVFQPV